MKRMHKTILKDLYESSEGLFAFTLYSRYKVSPSELFKFIEEYSTKGIISYENDRLNLTKEGKMFFFKQLFWGAKSSNGKFSRIPEEFLAQKIEINSPYLPNVNDVSLEILDPKEVDRN